MISKEEQQELGEAMRRLAASENLILNKIIYRAPYKGTKRRLGTHIRYKTKVGLYDIGSHKILLYLTSANFVLDPNGKYQDKKGNKYSRLVRGKEIPFTEVVATAAHELAHIKYHDHSRKHKLYTQDLFQKLKIELGELWQKKSISSTEDNTTVM